MEDIKYILEYYSEPVKFSVYSTGYKSLIGFGDLLCWTRGGVFKIYCIGNTLLEDMLDNIRRKHNGFI